MKKLTLIAATAALLLPLAATAGPMKAGKWQVTVETPQGNHSIERCVTKEEADNPQPPKMKNDDCKIENYKVDGNVVTWKVTCPATGMTLEGKNTYTGDTFTGETHMKMGEREMTQKSSGKYLGACDGTEAPKK
jgi:hypothetical protein